MEKRTRITSKELNALINNAYLEGYHDGYAAAERESVFKCNTINDIRKALGLPEITKREEVIE